MCRSQHEAVGARRRRARTSGSEHDGDGAPEAEDEDGDGEQASTVWMVPGTAASIAQSRERERCEAGGEAGGEASTVWMVPGTAAITTQSGKRNTAKKEAKRPRFGWGQGPPQSPSSARAPGAVDAGVLLEDT
eukprot:CAMPEP_0185720814 /NCGR_PEP_ID=MMETSP1164-20130828/50304_1 /TAXON_ID=1104430 /ORGANISM="Chrysoreinhardia sp, Strain CCMP2950" /LENGTH=132 /DNA_ID=CAMNT_0028388475 /DNA_START=172 /DNA_END=570 /DNA_ORIENTATION=+